MLIIILSNYQLCPLPLSLDAIYPDIYPWSLGLKSFLGPSQLPGEYTACAQYMHYSAKPITKKHLCPHRTIIVKFLIAQGHTITTGIRIHTPAEPKHKSLSSVLLLVATTPLIYTQWWVRNSR